MSKKIRNVLLTIIIIFAALAFIVWKLGANKKENTAHTDVVKESNNGAVPVLVYVAVTTPFDPRFDANGNFVPVRSLTYLAQSAGQITQLLVDEGSYVQQGQVMAVLDDKLLQADLVNQQSRLDQAARDKARMEAALPAGGVTQKQVDDARFQYDQIAAQVEQAKKRINDASIKAPISGVVNKKYVEQGTYLALGNKIVDIVDVSRLKLTVNVPEGQVVGLKVGNKVDVTANVYPEAHYSGRITFIAVQGDANLSYPVDIEIGNDAGKPVKAGMYGTAHFTLPSMQPMMLVPRSSFNGGVNSGEVYVMKGGLARIQKVVAGRIYGDRVEVREGLNQGDTVITSGQVNLVDGTQVTVQKQ
ncbi:efflux RND transporter periplasmic adaptor subunit [Dinghuibacter silviterrae]|uniref:RND family efflux transporter MFP subunit n=1 Tax=Dinghuibacter silviterrae TaxID=1539049 RepID=A0A4R8DXQ3_9BACT|nr:efflux RND transporter periplasmic adaptor subunit [Dinghuibacter silviterrae]TDX02217.1 RND family efflux transporter MFP subunit [Dinghuibacter silviterrae]